MKVTELKNDENYLIFIHDSKNIKTTSISFNENEFHFILDDLLSMEINSDNHLIIEFLKDRTSIDLKSFLNYSLDKKMHLLFESKFLNINLL